MVRGVDASRGDADPGVEPLGGLALVLGAGFSKAVHEAVPAGCPGLGQRALDRRWDQPAGVRPLLRRTSSLSAGRTTSPMASLVEPELMACSMRQPPPAPGAGSSDSEPADGGTGHQAP